jgi:hypothetical protein
VEIEFGPSIVSLKHTLIVPLEYDAFSLGDAIPKIILTFAGAGANLGQEIIGSALTDKNGATLDPTKPRTNSSTTDLRILTPHHNKLFAN